MTSCISARDHNQKISSSYLDATPKTLIRELQTLSPEDEHYEAKVTVLGEYVQHHVKEEEQELFPKAHKSLSA